MSNDPYYPPRPPYNEPTEQQSPPTLPSPVNPPSFPPPPPVNPASFPSAPAPPPRRKRPIIIGLIISIALIILSVGAVITHIYLPASAATVTLIPLHQSLSQSHTFSMAATSDFTNNKVGTHQVSYTTPTTTKQENTASLVHLDATQAKGHLVIIPRNATSSGAIKNLIIHGANGLDVETDQYPYVTLVPGQSTTVPAHIAKAGAVGNVSAYFINGDYNPGDDPGLILHIYNPEPFSGGADGYDGPVVKKSDLNQVESDLSMQLQQDSQQNLQKLLKPGEGLLETKCLSHIQSQPPDGTRGGTVTASGTVTCTGTAYDQQGLQDWMQNDMQQAAGQRFGPHLGLVNKTKPDITLFTDTIRASMQSDWAVKLDTDGKKALTRAIAGKSQDEARAILSKQFWVQTASINLSGWGLYMPADPNTIQIVSQGGTILPTPTY